MTNVGGTNVGGRLIMFLAILGVLFFVGIFSRESDPNQDPCFLQSGSASPDLVLRPRPVTPFNVFAYDLDCMWRRCDGERDVFGKPLPTKESLFQTSMRSLDSYMFLRVHADPRLTSDPANASVFYVPAYVRQAQDPSLLTEHTDELWGILVKQNPALQSAPVDVLRRHFMVGSTPGQHRFGGMMKEVMAHEQLRHFTVVMLERDDAIVNSLAVPYPSIYHQRRLPEPFPPWRPRNRSSLACFVGTPFTPLRKKLSEVCTDAEDCSIQELKGRRLPDELDTCLDKSTFCFQPAGNTKARKGIFDALAFGCIPVMFHPRTMDLQLHAPFPQWQEKFGLYLPEQGVLNGTIKVMNYLRQLSPSSIESMRAYISQHGPSLHWADFNIANKLAHSPDAPDAYEVLIRGLPKHADLNKQTDQQDAHGSIKSQAGIMADSHPVPATKIDTLTTTPIINPVINLTINRTTVIPDTSVAWCFAGQPRGFQHKYVPDSMLKYMLGPSSTSTNKVFFYMTNDDEGSSNFKNSRFSDNETVVRETMKFFSPEELYSYYGPHVEDPLLFQNHSCSVLNHRHKGSGQPTWKIWLLTWEKIRRCYEQVEKYEREHEMRFTFVVRVRPDMVFFQPMPNVNEWSRDSLSIPVGLAFCPRTIAQNCYNDHFVIAPRHLATAYFNHVHDLCLLPDMHKDNGGTHLKAALDSRGAPAVMVRVAYTLMRKSGPECGRISKNLGLPKLLTDKIPNWAEVETGCHQLSREFSEGV